MLVADNPPIRLDRTSSTKFFEGERRDSLPPLNLRLYVFS
jgi:hypothetical protein